MESESVKYKKRANCTLDSTLELPILKAAARDKVDIYLPSRATSWRGPALQEPIQQPSSDVDYGQPPKGILRPVDTTFSELSAHEELPSDKSSSIRRYSRRSAKRGMIYTVVITVLLAIGGYWAIMHFDTVQQALLTKFN